MPKVEAEGVSRATASTAVVPTATPRVLSMRPIASAMSAPAMMAPQDARGGRAGPPSGAATRAVPGATAGPAAYESLVVLDCMVRALLSVCFRVCVLPLGGCAVRRSLWRASGADLG